MVHGPLVAFKRSIQKQPLHGLLHGPCAGIVLWVFELSPFSCADGITPQALFAVLRPCLLCTLTLMLPVCSFEAERRGVQLTKRAPAWYAQQAGKFAVVPKAEIKGQAPSFHHLYATAATATHPSRVHLVASS